MFAGNLIAIGQDNLKRMLAASGIVHSGYLLIALVAIIMTMKGVNTGESVMAPTIQQMSCATVPVPAISITPTAHSTVAAAVNIEQAGQAGNWPL